MFSLLDFRQRRIVLVRLAERWGYAIQGTLAAVDSVEILSQRKFQVLSPGSTEMIVSGSNVQLHGAGHSRRRSLGSHVCRQSVFRSCSDSNTNVYQDLSIGSGVSAISGFRGQLPNLMVMAGWQHAGGKVAETLNRWCAGLHCR